MSALQLLIFVAANAALTMTVSQARIFSRLRGGARWCAYCTSHWSCAVVLALGFWSIPDWRTAVLLWLAIITLTAPFAWLIHTAYTAIGHE